MMGRWRLDQELFPLSFLQKGLSMDAGQAFDKVRMQRPPPLFRMSLFCEQYMLLILKVL